MSPSPRAIRHFGRAAMEARAERTRQVVRSEPQARPPQRFILRLWLPMTPIFLLLAPFAILLIPLLYLAPPLRRMNCAAAVFVLGDALLALSGTVVDVDAPDALVRIKIL